MRAAIVSKTTGIVVNVIELEPEARFTPGDKYDVIVSETAEIGDKHVNGVFERE